MKPSRFVYIFLLCVSASACSTRVIDSGEGPPAYRINDGSLCRAPAGFAELADSPGTRQLRALFLSSGPAEEVVAEVSDLPSDQELEAGFYLSCGEYARGELSKSVFSRQRRIYQWLRLEQMTRGIARWREEDDGFEVPGKVCHFIFNGDNPDTRNVTRLVPAQTSVDDCALYVYEDGGTHVLLGCSSGRWKTDWAAQPLLAGPNGWENRRRSPAGTQYVPEPNCGWG
jgi:hypothetical protein